MIVIDKATGALIINDELSLGRNLSLSDFKKLPHFDIWLPVEQSHIVYQTKIHELTKRNLTIWVIFHRYILQRILFSFFLSYEKDERRCEVTSQGWGIDLNREKLHEEILNDILGSSPYQYSWGYILIGRSNLDPCSIISVNYNLHSKNDSALAVKYD